MEMELVYLAFGANLGNRKKTIDNAIEMLKQYSGIVFLKQARFYETKPIGYKSQPKFLNTVISVYCKYMPHELLKITQSIEKTLGREKTFHWGPRNIDIDILLYGAKTIKSKKLTIPHPRMYERAFVLIPLFDIDESFKEKFSYLLENNSSDVILYTPGEPIHE